MSYFNDLIKLRAGNYGDQRYSSVSGGGFLNIFHILLLLPKKIVCDPGYIKTKYIQIKHFLVISYTFIIYLKFRFGTTNCDTRGLCLVLFSGFTPASSSQGTSRVYVLSGSKDWIVHTSDLFAVLFCFGHHTFILKWSFIAFYLHIWGLDHSLRS